MPYEFPVPCAVDLDRPIEPGQTLAIKAKLFDEIDKDSNDSRITLNLNCDREGKNSDQIVFHANFRFDENETVFNSKIDGEWGDEEKERQTLKEGEEFTLRVRVHDDRYEVELNGVDYHNFEHRAPVSHINHLFIDGPFVLNSLSWGGRYYAVPYESRLDCPIGKRLLLSGTPHGDAERFSVNFHCNNNDIAFHFNPRFNDNEIVRNSEESGQWGPEEKEGEMPFKKNVTFDMMIYNDHEGYQVYVDGDYLCSFYHRLSSDICSLSVEGDLELTSLQVI